MDLRFFQVLTSWNPMNVHFCKVDTCFVHIAVSDTQSILINKIIPYHFDDFVNWYCDDTDIDECITNNGECSPEASCSNTVGSFTCTCLSGYTGDGYTCTGRSYWLFLLVILETGISWYQFHELTILRLRLLFIPLLLFLFFPFSPAVLLLLLLIQFVPFSSSSSCNSSLPPPSSPPYPHSSPSLPPSPPQPPTSFSLFPSPSPLHLLLLILPISSSPPSPHPMRRRLILLLIFLVLRLLLYFSISFPFFSGSSVFSGVLIY